MTFALTLTGISVQTVDEVFDELAVALRAKTGQPNLDLSSTAPLGQVLGVVAEREVKRQQVARDVYNSRHPGRATGDALVQLALLTGTVKRGTTKSVVGTVVTLTAGTTLPAGSRANVDGDVTAAFETLGDVTNSSGSTDDIAVEMTAVGDGPVRALAGTLTIINTPVSGWNAVTNPFGAQLGLNPETDPELRFRREEELRSQGSSALAAIVADVDEVDGVVQAVGFENTTDSIFNNLPPHSFEIVVWDGDTLDASNNAVVQAIFDASPAGITSGSSGLGTLAGGTAVEATSGDEFVLFFTRALVQTLYLEYDLTVDAELYPIDGDTQVKAAAVAFVNSRLSIGDDVIATQLFAPAYSIAGVLDVVAVRLGFTASPVGTSNLAVASRSIARADTSRVLVTS